jgi:O-antigen/teichoic acid export membrane protein
LYNSREAGRYLQTYALLTPILYCDAVTDAMTKGLGQQKVCVRYNIFTSCMDVVLLYFLLPVWGMEGYFFSFTVTHLINFGLSLRRLLKISRYRLSAWMPILAGMAAILSAWGASCLGAVFARGSAYILLLGSLLVLFRVVGKEDVLWIKGVMKPERY